MRTAELSVAFHVTEHDVSLAIDVDEYLARENAFEERFVHVESRQPLGDSLGPRLPGSKRERLQRRRFLVNSPRPERHGNSIRYARTSGSSGRQQRIGQYSGLPGVVDDRPPPAPSNNGRFRCCRCTLYDYLRSSSHS